MKTQKFKIPLYNWKVAIIKINKSDSIKDVKKALKRANCAKAVIDEELSRFEQNQVDNTHSGIHAYNSSFRQSIIVLNNVEKGKDTLKVLSHELDHVRYIICDYLYLQDRESQACLMGYLCEKAIPEFYN